MWEVRKDCFKENVWTEIADLQTDSLNTVYAHVPLEASCFPTAAHAPVCKSLPGRNTPGNGSRRHTEDFTEALSTNRPKLETPKHPSTGKRTNHYTFIQKNTIKQWNKWVKKKQATENTYSIIFIKFETKFNYIADYLGYVHIWQNYREKSWPNIQRCVDLLDVGRSWDMWGRSAQAAQLSHLRSVC